MLASYRPVTCRLAFGLDTKSSFSSRRTLVHAANCGQLTTRARESKKLNIVGSRNAGRLATQESWAPRAPASAQANKPSVGNSLGTSPTNSVPSGAAPYTTSAEDAKSTLKSPIPVFKDLKSMREWRRNAYAENKTVGFVPTLGALHDGHMSLVRYSLERNDLTVISIFVNPWLTPEGDVVQTYRQTPEADLALISSVSVPSPNSGDPPKTVSALFMPTFDVMYPGGVKEELSRQTGSVVEIQGFGSPRDREIRPHYFRGAATQATKLFQAVQPTAAYFGAKDIQQALLIRRVARDLLFGSPSLQNLQIVPTFRDSNGLALASRNAYLTKEELAVAPVFYKALKAAEAAWQAGEGREASVQKAIDLIESTAREVKDKGIDLRVDHFEMHETDAYAVAPSNTHPNDGKPIVLSGAVWFGQTRLVDTILLGDWPSETLL
ncbi:pantothenate synthase [Tulasnella sp. 418]|nr:pantothenate synthase [Tulasnella sp. 418]